MKADDIEALIDAWKQVVQTQMHFNDLELKIRNFAFILTGAFLALGGYALKEGDRFQLPFTLPLIGDDISVSSAIFLSAIPPLLGFWFMDRYWYHPLLLGSVYEGAKLEKVITQKGLKLSMGQEISWQSGMLNWVFGERRLFSNEERERYRATKEISPFDRWIEKDGKFLLKNGLFTMRSFRSHHKMMAFYGILIASMLFVAWVVKDVGGERNSRSSVDIVA